jgi:alanyl-tRNA synthetase
VGALVQEVRDLKKQVASGKKTAAGATPEDLLREADTLGGAKVVVAEVPGGNANLLREQIDLLRRKTQPLAALLASRDGDKVLLVAGITRDLEQRGISAVDWVKAASALVGGGGGGRPDMAQAGGKDPEKLPAALEAARQKARELLGA